MPFQYHVGDVAKLVDRWLSGRTDPDPMGRQNLGFQQSENGHDGSSLSLYAADVVFSEIAHER